MELDYITKLESFIISQPREINMQSFIDEMMLETKRYLSYVNTYNFNQQD